MGFAPLHAQQRGKASYYAKRATGARTASGERLHHDSLTCAHKRYPFGTMLKVTNIKNGKTTVVRVNDRGPFVRGRIIDLSYAAAREIGMLSAGITTVEVEEIEACEVPFILRARQISNIKFGFTDADSIATIMEWQTDSIYKR